MTKKMEIVILAFAILGLSSKMFATPMRCLNTLTKCTGCEIATVSELYGVKQVLADEYEISRCVKDYKGFTKSFTDWNIWNIIQKDIQLYNDPTKPQTVMLYKSAQLGAPAYLVIVNNLEKGGYDWNHTFVYTLRKTRGIK